MKDYFETIKDKIKKNVKLESIEIVDNSQKHKNHKFFSPDRYHLHIKIKSIHLNSLSRINAQKIVMKILADDLKTKIHALEISIEK